MKYASLRPKPAAQRQTSREDNILRQSQQVLRLCEMVRQNIGKLSHTPEERCLNCPDAGGKRQPCSETPLDIESVERTLKTGLSFRKDLFFVKRTAFEEIPMSEPEMRRYRVIQDSLELFRNRLQMDYSGIGLIKDGNMITTHEVGTVSSESSNLDALQKEVCTIIEDTKVHNYVHSCYSHYFLGGFDTVFLFHNIQGEPFGYLVLKKNDDSQNIDSEPIDQLGWIFYNQLYAIIREEDTLLMKKELVEIRQELKNIKSRLESFRHDQLTGLLGRLAALEIFENSFERIRRSKRGAVASIVIMDIDHFKKINDTFGHSEGDHVLRELGALLTNGGIDHNGQAYTLRKTDTPCRWGGEEFLLLLEETDAAGAQIFIEKLRRSIESLKITTSSLQSISVTITAGIKEIKTEDFADGDKTKTFEFFVNQADTALYQGKASGRNRVIIAE